MFAETMYDARNAIDYTGRTAPWDGIGEDVSNALNSADAIKAAGLDWEVYQQEVRTESGLILPGYRANLRSSDNSCLGIVTDRYKIVQNSEAFSFTDELIGGDVRYETAGSLHKGKTVWMLARLPEMTILDDTTVPYLCFSNSHDGTGAVKVCVTPIRVICQNTLNLALNKAKRVWSVKHTGVISEKISEARMCLEFAGSYMENLNKEADYLANVKIDRDGIDEILNALFPVKAGASDREIANVKKLKDEFMICYFAPDLAKFMNTGWGAINAMSDMATHNAPRRKTANYRENNWGRVMNGHAMIDGMVTAVKAYADKHKVVA